MRRVAIIQARMGSSRLPGKVLADLAGKPMLAHLIDRVRRAQCLDAIVVATTTLTLDDPIVAVCAALGVQTARGDADDVLSRYVLAADHSGADLIVRLTADCPLIDWQIIDDVVALCSDCDYAANVLQRHFPRGLDVEALHRDALVRCDRLAQSAAAREHVTWFIREEARALFVTRNLGSDVDHSALRWTVDTAEDLELVRQMYVLGAASLGYPALLALWAAHPELWTLNAHVEQK